MKNRLPEGALPRFCCFLPYFSENDAEIEVSRRLHERFVLILIHRFEAIYRINTFYNMNIEELRDFCLSLPDAAEAMPFDETTLVFKVNGKIFALTDLEGPLSVNLKCDPELAIGLREHYPSVTPGYHMNKKHWNTVLIDGSVPDVLIREWIMNSYRLVAGKNRKKK